MEKNNFHRKIKEDMKNEEEADNKKFEHNVELEKIGENLAIIRKMFGLTQVEFAKALEITSQTLSLIECGKFPLTNNLASKIYFSLYEIVKDEQIIEVLQLQEYAILAIKELMNLLRIYIRGLNLNFSLYLKKGNKN